MSRIPDSVRSPLRFAGGGDSFSKLAKLHEEFSAVLRVPRVHVRHQGTEHFISGRADDTLQFHGPSRRSGEARYTWEDRGDGILYGYLVCHE